MAIKKAIIPVAGFGTRFLPATKAVPKALFPILDKPAIHYIVEEAVASGIEEICIIIGSQQKAIMEYFARSTELENHLTKTGKGELLKSIKEISQLAEITYIVQQEARGLGHAIFCARDFINHEPFGVLLGDDLVFSSEPCLGQLIKETKVLGNNILGLQPVAHKKLSYYGIVQGEQITERLIKVEELVEKPSPENAPSNLAILGRYILDSEIFQILENTEPGKGGEIQLTDALRGLKEKQNIYGYIFEGIRYDIGDKLGYLKATIDTALEKDDLQGEFREYLKNIREIIL